jgi:pyridoxal phosphate-dependent aminotransferase EpsN
MTRIYLSPPHMGPDERDLLLEAFDSNWIAPLGPHVDAFERELAEVADVPHAAALSSGTAGLHLALLLLGVEASDVVLTSTLTFAATANAIAYVGAEPAFVDADARSWTMDPQRLDDAIATLDREGRRPTAVIAVDLYGQCCDYEAIEAICARWELPLVEDAAESLGSTAHGRPAGGFGDIGVFSFNGNKIITTSGGGMLVSRHEAHVSRARFLATQARDPAPHYQHSTIGYNYRLSNLLAAVGRGQLRTLPDKVAARRANRDHYRQTLGDLPGVTLLEDAPWCRSNSWLTCLQIDADALGVDRETIRLHLDADGIESRPVWKPMHLQPVFAERRCFGGEVSDRLFRDGLCLPSGSSLTDADLARIVARFRSTPGLRG